MYYKYSIILNVTYIVCDCTWNSKWVTWTRKPEPPSAERGECVTRIRYRRRMAGIIRIHFVTLNINNLFNITHRWRAVRVYSSGAETEIFNDPGIDLRMSNTVGYLAERTDERPIGRISSVRNARRSWRDADGSRGIRSSTSPITQKDIYKIKVIHEKYWVNRIVRSR